MLIHLTNELMISQALLDNPNERILHNMLFRYLETRAYYDSNAPSAIQTWSDEEDEREKQRSIASEPKKSVTLKPNNILKVINKWVTQGREKESIILIFECNVYVFLSFLLLLPRQIISDSIGTCYEEYVQDANRHYKVKALFLILNEEGSFWMLVLSSKMCRIFWNRYETSQHPT